MTKGILNNLVYIVGLGMALSACGGSDGASATANPTLTLGITDAPVDNAEEVVVRFTGVELIPAEEGGDGAERKTISYAEAKMIDLLALQGGMRDLLLDGEELTAGKYGQIRLLVQAEHDNVMDSYITVNGAQHELRIPSGKETGLKLVHEINLEPGSSSDYTIDFDLRKSVVFAPGQGYMLKPVLRLVETEGSGEISGIIDPVIFAGQTCSADPLTGYGVYVYQGAGAVPEDLGSAAEPLATASVSLNESSEYAYTVAFLEPGEYTVAATCQADQDVPDQDQDEAEVVFVAVTNVTVPAGILAHNFQ